MPTWSTHSLSCDGGHIVFSAVRLRKILSAELFNELIGFSTSGNRLPVGDLAAQCHARWTDLADSLAALPEPAEMMVVLGCLPATAHNTPQVTVAFLAVGRGATRAQAEQQCVRTQGDLWTLLETILDYA